MQPILRQILFGARKYLPYEQIVASNGRYPMNWLTSPTASQVQLQARRASSTGGQPVWYFRLGYCSYAYKSETSLAATFNIEAAIEIPTAPNPGPFRATFSGANSLDMAPGLNVVSDQVFASQFGYTNGVPAGTQIFIRESLLVGGSGTSFTYPLYGGPGTEYIIGTGEQSFFSSPSTSQVMATGNMTQPVGGSAASSLPPLVAIIGAFTRPEVSLIIVGDSIAQGSKDTNGSGYSGTSGGWFVRPAWGASGRNIPWSNLAVINDTVSNYLTMTKRQFWYKYATHAISDYVVNDIAVDAASAATIRTNLRLLWASLKNGGISHVSQTLCVPKTTSTDSWATSGNQTVVTNFGDGSTRDTINGFIVADEGTNSLDEVIDFRSMIEDGSDHTKWRSDGSTAFGWTRDGLHPFGFSFVTGNNSAFDLLQTRYAAWVPARTSAIAA